jgi:hypothetical protein
MALKNSRNDDGPRTGKHDHQQTTVNQPPGQRRHEGWDAQVGDHERRDRAEHRAQQQHAGDHQPDRQAPLLERNGCDRAEEAHQITDRQVDVPDHNNQRHTNGQHGNVAGLIQQIADIT